MHSLVAARFPWEPALLAGVVPGLLIDPGRLAFADAAEVDTITNAGSLGGTVAQGSSTLRPLMRRNHAGTGKHAIDFDGVNDRLVSSAGFATSLLGGAWTLVAVIDLDGIAAAAAQAYQDAAILIDDGGFAGLTVRSNAGTPEVGAYRWNTVIARATMGGTGVRQVVSVRFNGTATVSARRALNARTTVAGSFGAGLSGTFSLGGYAGSTAFLNGKILWLGGWASQLSDAAEDRLIAGAMAYYGAT